MLDDSNKVAGAAYVALRGPVQTVPAAELWALRILLRHCGVSVDVASDCAFVVNGFNGARGRERTLRPTSVPSGAWRMVWQHVDDIVHGHVVVRKIRAHATRTDVRLGRVTERDRISNEAADHFAKLEANLHPHCASSHSRANSRQCIPLADWKHPVALHKLVQSGPCALCTKCGCYASRVVPGLRKGCPGFPPSAGKRRIAEWPSAMAASTLGTRACRTYRRAHDGNGVMPASKRMRQDVTRPSGEARLAALHARVVARAKSRAIAH